MLDEPSAGLNAAETDAARRPAPAPRDDGVPILLIDHKLDFITSLCDRVAVLELGHLVAVGPAANGVRRPARRRRVPRRRRGRLLDARAAATSRCRTARSKPCCGIDLDGRQRRCRRADRPERRGQDVDAERDLRPRRPTAARSRSTAPNAASSACRAAPATGLIQVPEGRRVFPTLTVHENLLVGETARRGAAPTYAIDDVYELFPPLVPLRDRDGWALSGGEQQMVAHRPRARRQPADAAARRAVARASRRS